MESLHSGLQENVLTLLVFDNQGCGLVRNTVPIQAFGTSIHRRIAQAAFDFYDAHKKPPKDHIADELDRELQGDNAALYADIMRGMDRLKENLNSDYVIAQLDHFNRLNSLRTNIVTAATALEDDDIEKAEECITNYHRQRRLTDHKSYSLDDVPRLLTTKALHRHVVSLGIRQLYNVNAGPCKKELFLFGAPPKAGKSAFMIHVARWCLFSRLRVLYVTLEMSAESVLTRMVQSVLSMATGSPKPVTLQVPLLKREGPRSKEDDKNNVPDNRLVNFGSTFGDQTRRSLDEEGIISYVEPRLKQFHNGKLFRVAERPTGSLTLNGLTGILDYYDTIERFIPDVLIVDYADLMKIDTREFRINTGELYKGLRGLAVERGLAMVSATQLNRGSVDTTRRRSSQVAEDFSKVFTSDAFLVYSQTEIEKELGIARLSLDTARHGTLSREVVISQCYKAGQFMLESGYANNNYYAQMHQARQRARPGAGDGENEEE